jgi:hypothetical protein
VRSLLRLADELSIPYRQRHAQTGTDYVTFECSRHLHCAWTTIRFANHADAYGTSDYTCDGFEGTLPGARKHLLATVGITEKVVRRLRRARKARAGRNRMAMKQCWIDEVLREEPTRLRADVEREADNIHFGSGQ